MRVWSMAAAKPASVENITTPPGEQATRAKLISQHAQVHAEMKAAVDWRYTHPTPFPQLESLFDDRGQATRQFFRVSEYTADSNFDHIPDHEQFGPGQNPFDQDIDNDGIPNGYDRDNWSETVNGQPGAPLKYPETYALLSNVLINEVLMLNEFTNADETGKSYDWVELYNPTNNTIDISGWYLSNQSGGTNRKKWAFPAGTTIGSGQFLIVWASDKTPDPAWTSLHTTYNLSAGDPPDTAAPSDPDEVVLSRPSPPPSTSAIIVDAFLPQAAAGRPATANFRGQRTDVSFGRYPHSAGLQTGYMILPTPGAHNVVGAFGFTSPPTFSTSSDKPGLYEGQTVTAILQPPVTGGAIHFTTNSANPTRYSELYSGPLSANCTVVIRAIAAKEGFIPSRSITRSYLFKEDILGTTSQAMPLILQTDHQGGRDSHGRFLGLLRGYPEATREAGYPLLYGMDAATIAARKATLSQELSAVPVVSLVGTVADIFDLSAGGIYPNSSYTGYAPADPRRRDWQRLCSFEFVEANKSNFVQGNACLLITGGSSIRTTVTRKHNFRVEFSSVHGDKKLFYHVFPDFIGEEFNTLHLKNPTHESWSNTWETPGGYLNGEAYKISQIATYCNDAWVRAALEAYGNAREAVV